MAPPPLTRPEARPVRVQRQPHRARKTPRVPAPPLPPAPPPRPETPPATAYGQPRRALKAAPAPPISPLTRSRPSIWDTSVDTFEYLNDRPARYPLPSGTPSLPRQHLVGLDGNLRERWQEQTPFTDTALHGTSPYTGDPSLLRAWWYDIELPTRKWWKRRLPRYADPLGIVDPYAPSTSEDTMSLSYHTPPADIPNAVYRGRDENGNATWAERDGPAGAMRTNRREQEFIDLPPVEPLQPASDPADSEPEAPFDIFRPSRMERKWSITQNEQGEVLYRIGSNVNGEPRYKVLQRYQRGVTERMYGVRPARRLRVRAPDEKGVAEIMVGFNLWGDEDWRPIWIEGYAGQFVTLVPDWDDDESDWGV